MDFAPLIEKWTSYSCAAMRSPATRSTSIAPRSSGELLDAAHVVRAGRRLVQAGIDQARDLHAHARRIRLLLLERNAFARIRRTVAREELAVVGRHAPHALRRVGRCVHRGIHPGSGIR